MHAPFTTGIDFVCVCMYLWTKRWIFFSSSSSYTLSHHFAYIEREWHVHDVGNDDYKCTTYTEETWDGNL